MSTRAQPKLVTVVTAVATGLLLWIPSELPGHVDSPLLLEGCGSCHVGHGMSGQPMLARAEEEFCYQCHGSASERSRMIDAGLLSPSAAALGDVESQFQKAYRHPVVEGVGHSPTEQLPVLGAGAVQHAECADCHNPHDKTRAGDTAVKNVRGYSLTGQRLETSTREIEICLKCHSDRLSLDKGERNLLEDFSIDARSQHPVTRARSGTRPPSIQTTAGIGGMMTCSDCHNSGDPDGPRGPHGSDNRFLLSGNYDVEVYTDESAFAFEFCYSCHDRSSILNNESFPLHREHIIGDPVAGRSGTSCYSCHVSHGSPIAPHMLEFNPMAVQPEELTGLTEYRSLGTRTGECYLKCHGFNHGPGRY